MQFEPDKNALHEIWSEVFEGRDGQELDVLRRQVLILAWQLAHRGAKPDPLDCMQTVCEARIKECTQCWVRYSEAKARK